MGSTMLEQAAEAIAEHIIWMGGRPVLLDHDLARIFGITTRRLRGVVERHPTCFPGELHFTPEREELLRAGHVVERCCGAFTMPGVIVAAALLKSPAVLVRSIQVARAFDGLRFAARLMTLS